MNLLKTRTLKIQKEQLCQRGQFFNQAFLQEKDEEELKTKAEFCNVLKLFYVEARKVL